MKRLQTLLGLGLLGLFLSSCASDGTSPPPPPIDPCEGTSADPQAELFANRYFGNEGTRFILNASNSEDALCTERTLGYRWDIDSDGVYDVPADGSYSSNPILNRSYLGQGMRRVTVEVKSLEATATASVDLKINGYTTIQTWAGTGVAGSTPNGTTLRETEFYTPQDMTFAPDGSVYILDWNNHRVLHAANGVTNNVCGTGTLGDAPEGTATLAGLNHPTDITIDPQGRLIMAAWHNSMVMRVDPVADSLVRLAGRRPTEAGNRCYDPLDEGSPAIESCLDLPVSTAFDSQGRLYISDQKNLRVVRVDPVDGVITDHSETGTQSTFQTIAGVPVEEGAPENGGFNGNGIPATEAWLSAPGGQSADPTSRIEIRNDVLYIADTQNNMIRSIDLSVPNPTIELVAGSGGLNEPAQGYAGDGGPATEARLYRPVDIAFDSQGNLFIADTFNNVIRKVEVDTGNIYTIAGSGAPNPVPFPEDARNGAAFGDGGNSLDAYISRPYGIALDQFDNLYIVDTYHFRVRIVYK